MEQFSGEVACIYTVGVILFGLLALSEKSWIMAIVAIFWPIAIVLYTIAFALLLIMSVATLLAVWAFQLCQKKIWQLRAFWIK